MTGDTKLTKRAPIAKTKETPLKIGFWHAVRDIAVTSINKGQFPLALIGAMLIVALVKMPWQAIENVLFRVVEKLAHWDLIGWLLWCRGAIKATLRAACTLRVIPASKRG